MNDVNFNPPFLEGCTRDGGGGDVTDGLRKWCTDACENIVFFDSE